MSLRTLSTLISILLHPLLVPSLFFITLFFSVPYTLGSSNIDLLWRLFVIVFLITFLIPMVCILLFYSMGIVKSLKMDEKSDRYIPFIFTTIFYMAASALFVIQINRLPIFGLMMSATTVSLLIVTVVTFFWKISAHSVGISGALGFLIGFAYQLGDPALLYPIIATTCISGLLMSARLYLQAHSPAQIATGAMLGFWVSLLSVIFFY